MYIDSPENTLRLASRQEDLTEDGTHYLLRMRRDSSKFFYLNRDARPSLKNYADAAQFLTEITGVDISAAQAEAMLSLYPRARIKLATDDGIQNTDVRDDLSFVAAHFFLGCNWPTYGSNVNINGFTELIKQSARLMNLGQIEISARIGG